MDFHQENDSDHLRHRTRSFRKRRSEQQKKVNHQISSSSSVTATDREEESSKQEARPLGTCVRKCGRCRQLKHILLAECTVCFRMIDVDLKDCKCQILTNRNVTEHFYCSICNSQLTLDGYVICANRTCQTTLSALIKIENNQQIEGKSRPSTSLTNICYPKPVHRTVAIQVNTLSSLPSLQGRLSTQIDNENKESSSSSSCSKVDRIQTLITSSGTSNTSDLSTDTGGDGSFIDIARNIRVGFNSNQPTKLALQSEDESQQSSSPNPLNTTGTVVDNSRELTETPKSPRCLAIMNARKRRDRLSALLILPISKACQTQLSCLGDVDKTIGSDDFSNVTIVQTNNPDKTERQIQVDTIRGHYDDLCQVRIEIPEHLERDPILTMIDDERILQALIDKDGQRWSELIDQLVNEQSNRSSNEQAQQLLSVIERLHPSGKLNSLTTGQLQRKIHYAMSQLKPTDEPAFGQNNLKTTEPTSSNERENEQCSGQMDMVVTVRQVAQPQSQTTEALAEESWKPYIDRLFEQGHSPDDIQQSLQKAAQPTLRNDNPYLKDVFNYIKEKADQQRAKTAPSRGSSIDTGKNATPIARQHIHSTNLFQTVKTDEVVKSGSAIMKRPSPSASERQVKADEPTLDFKEKNRDLTSVSIKHGSSSIRSDKKSVINLNEDPSEREEKPQQDTICTTTTKKLNDKALSDLEGRCINALQAVQNSLDNIDRLRHSHSSNTQTELNKLITAFESHLLQSDTVHRDDIELLMVQCIEHWNNQKKSNETRNLRYFANKLAMTLKLLQSSKNIAVPVKTNKKDSPFNQQMANMIETSPNPSAPSKQIESQPLSEEQIGGIESQEISKPIRCRRIPYTSSKEKTSAISLHQVVISSTESIPSKSKDSDEQIITNPADLKNVLDESSKAENDVQSNQGQTEWLSSLLSKISDNDGATAINDQTKVELDAEQQTPQSLESKNEDKETPILDVYQPTNSPSKTINDEQNILYETHLIKLEEMHVTPMIVPDRNMSVLDELFQLAHVEISPKKSTANMEDQVTPMHNEKSNVNIETESVNLDHDSSAPSSPENHLQHERQSQSMSSQPISNLNIGLSDQLDQRPIDPSTEQLTTDNTFASEDNFSSSHKHVSSENEENKSSRSISNAITSSKTSVKSSSIHDLEVDETNIVSDPPDKSEDQNSKKTDELAEFTERTSSSSQNDAQTLDQHISKADSRTFHHQNDLNKLRLPVSTEHLSHSQSVKSNSSLIHLNNQDDSQSSNQSISNSSSRSKTEAHSLAQIPETDSEDQIVTAATTKTEDSQSSNPEIDEKTTGEMSTPVILSPNSNVVQQSATVVLSPLQTTRIEENRYKKLTIPSSVSLKPASSVTIIASKEKDPTRIPNEEKSETLTKEDEQEKSRSVTSTSNSQNMIRVDETQSSKSQLNYNDDPHTFSNTSMQDTSSIDDPTHSSQKPSKSMASFPSEETDGQLSTTAHTTNKKHSQPKIRAEDIKSPVALTFPSSVLSTIPNNDTPRKPRDQLDEKAQLITQDSKSSPSNNSTGNNIKGKPSSDESTSSSAQKKNSETKYDKSEDNLSIHSSLQSEISDNDEDRRPRRESSSRIARLIKLLPSPPTQQSLASDQSENEDSVDQIHLVDYDSESKGQLNIEKPLYTDQHISPMILHSMANRIKSSSAIMRRNVPTMSTIPTILPSSVITVKSPEHKFKSQLSSFDAKTAENQGSVSVSSFNLTQLIDLTPHNHPETENQRRSSSHSKKSLLDDTFHPIVSKQQSSSTNSLVRDSVPSSLVPKLLLKRSSFKPPSAMISPIKPNPVLSITDASLSSSNTIATDHLLNTHSTMSDYEEIMALKKAKKKMTADLLPRFNVLRKTSPPSLIDSNRGQRPAHVSKTKIKKNYSLKHSQSTYDTEPGSEDWLKNRQDSDERPKTRKKKKRTANGSRQMPFYVKNKETHYPISDIDSSKLPNIGQTCGDNLMKRTSHEPYRRPIIRLPVTQIEKFECGTIGPHLHPSSLAYQLLSLPSISQRSRFSSDDNQITESFTNRLYSLMSPENNMDQKAFESIVHWQEQHPIPRIEQNKFQYMYLMDTSAGNSVRGKQYPILTDEIDLIDDPNSCTIVNKWAFADLVKMEREKFMQRSEDYRNTSKKKSSSDKRIQICLRKRPLTEFEENVLKEVDIISIVDPQTVFLHIPSITIDNQVFIKNRKIKCDQTFDEYCQISTIYDSTLAPLLDTVIDGHKCLCLIGGGRFSGKTSLLRSLTDFLTSDLNRLLSTYDISIKLLGVCHNRMVDILQNYSPIRLMKSKKRTLIPNDQFHLETREDIDYITCQLKKRRRFMHQLIQINFHEKSQSKQLGSLMIVLLASSQYVYTRNLCSHRRKFLINSLNKTILSFKRALLGIRQNPNRIQTAFNNDILTRLMQPYVFDQRSNICYIGTLNPGHRHRIATKSTLEFTRNLRFCFKRLEKKRRQRKAHAE